MGAFIEGGIFFVVDEYERHFIGWVRRCEFGDERLEQFRFVCVGGICD